MIFWGTDCMILPDDVNPCNTKKYHWCTVHWKQKFGSEVHTEMYTTVWWIVWFIVHEMVLKFIHHRDGIPEIPRKYYIIKESGHGQLRYVLYWWNVAGTRNKSGYEVLQRICHSKAVCTWISVISIKNNELYLRFTGFTQFYELEGNLIRKWKAIHKG